jgi:hypothetical protein
MQEDAGEKQGSKTLSWSQPQKPLQTAPVQQNLSMKSLASATSASAATPAGKSHAGLYAGIFIAGLIVGIVAGWLFTGAHGGSVATTQKEGELTGGAAVSTSNGTVSESTSTTGLVVPSPQPAGLAVSVSHVDVTAPTWVVIYEDHGGVAGRALGAGLFFPPAQGGATSGTVELLRATSPGETYLAGESLDDGDRIFSTTTDKPVRDAQGNPVWVEFKTQ